MSFNGSGVFNINTSGQPVASGTVISSTAFNLLTADLANGLTLCITKDGQSTPTANIPMGNNRIITLANGLAATDAATLGQVQSSIAKLLTSVTGADTITAVASPTLTAYTLGQMFYFVAAGSNTTTVTINIDSLGAKSITRDGTTALAAGDIQSGEVCVIVYDGTQFQLVNGASQSASIVTENLTVNKATVLNESGGDNDTRIEGDTDANLFFVDASTDRIGIGTSTPDAKFTVNGVGAFGDGAVGTPSIANTGDLNTGLWFPTADTLAVSTGGVEALRVDASQNLGLGVTPSAWFSNGKALQLGSGAFVLGTTTATQVLVGANFYYDGSNNKYIANGEASYHQQTAGKHEWFTAPSGTAGNTITFTQAMTLDASGNLSVAYTDNARGGVVVSTTNNSGTSEQGGFLVTNGNSTGLFAGVNGAAYSTGGIASANNAVIYSIGNQALAFGTNTTERARITASGYWKADPNGTYYGVANDYHEFRSTNGNQNVLIVSHAGTNGQQYGMGILTANDQNDATRYFFSCVGGATERGTLRSNGGLANYSANNVNLASDERLKKDISPLDSAWGKVKGMEVVNFRYKDCNEGDPLLYGVIAQQVQPIVPELVVVTREATETDPEYYGIREQPMYWLAIKALQEAMTRIEQLEAKVAALEAP